MWPPLLLSSAGSASPSSPGLRDSSSPLESERGGPPPKPQVALAPAAWGGPAMRRPSLHGAGEFVSATWEMINGNFFECAAAASLEPPSV
jgi:hypothetical protein